MSWQGKTWLMVVVTVLISIAVIISTCNGP